MRPGHASLEGSARSAVSPIWTGAHTPLCWGSTSATVAYRPCLGTSCCGSPATRPCLFPQHGPGRKHERPIILEPWQREIVEEHPSDFLRGLFHSDGSRVANRASRQVAGVTKRYDYPRWQFVNHSEDILGLCEWALDQVGIARRRSKPTTVSVSRRSDVRRLDQLIGLKS
jgi:hypothetical protein